MNPTFGDIPIPMGRMDISRRGGNKRELLAWLGSLLILRIANLQDLWMGGPLYSVGSRIE
ncbi:hypothetical protein IEQ34_025713 [Dendrobium chrysotoxum]|uniref:Uncharacterized protein n=1 Tax=Dendrobium chrysotoxum TaxID=161865 RepID=A0AAV7FIX1_DENCH|nr:hypothetical protein IEQ34_025713 [Dendrobium chrysotoxum]